MSFTQAIQHVFRNYAVFDGRARRSEFWYFQLFNYGITLALLLLSFAGLGPLLFIYMAATFIPNLAVWWRRLHDVGRSGAWYFIAFTFVGAIVLIVWCAEDSQLGNNQYGANPKTGAAYGGAAGYYGGNSRSNGPAQGSLAVQCLFGPLQGQTYPIRGNEILFGREGACAVRMPDGTPGVSRRHCCIRLQQGVPVLIDLASSYGTFLADGKQLPPNYPEPVAAGTRFYLGNSGNLFQIIVF